MAFAGILVPDAISAEDCKQIPQEILTKIELYITTLSETNCALRDTWRTKEEYYESKISKYEQESAKFLEEVDKEREKQHVCELMLKEAEGKLEVLKNELSAEQQRRKILETENTELCRLRDFARQESVMLQSSLALSGVDVKRLEEKCKALTLDLQRATDAKYAALVECREEKSATMAVQARYDKLELQVVTLRRHNQDLTGSLSKHKEDLGRTRRDYCDRVASLEAQLVAKMEECTKQAKAIDSLRTSLKNAEEMVEKLGNRLNKQQEAEVSLKEGFQKELQSVTNVMNIYKCLSQDGESTVEEALSKAKQMSHELEETISLYKSAEEKLVRTESEFQKLLSEKDECIAAKEQEIKATYDLVAATIKEEMTETVEKLPAGSELRRQLQDCGSMANFIQHCSSLAEKLRILKKENKLNVLYMKKLFKEVEVKAPMIKKQQEDYERAMNTVVEQSQQIDTMNEEIKQSRKTEALFQDQLSDLEKENYCLRSQVADLGEQVRNLLLEVEHARTGADKPSEDTSKNLIIFGNIKELQEQNQKLLELFAELNMPKENTESTEDTIVLQEHLARYETQIKDMQEEIESYKAMTRSLTEERNTYRKLYQRSIYGRCGIYVEESEKEYKPSDFSVEELTKQLAMTDKDLTELRMSSESYDRQQQAAEQAMLEEQGRLSEELTKASDEAALHYGELQVCRQRLKMLEDATNAARQQVATLEGQNNSYCSRAADDKRAIRFFKEMAQKWEQKAAWQQQQAEQLQRELEKMKAAVRGSGPLVGSGDCHPRLGERLTQLLQQLDAASTALEHREEERGESSQQQLSTAYQECLLLSRHLQEARNDLEGERARLLLDIDTSLKKVVLEKKKHSALEASLKAAQADIERKSHEIIQLNQKLAESRALWKAPSEMPQFSTSTPETDSWRRRAEDLEAQLAQRLGEMELLQLRLDEAQGQAATFSDMSEQFERQCKEEADQRRAAQELYDSQLCEAKQLEEVLRAEVKELTEKISRLPEDGSEPALHLQSQLDALQAERDALRDELHAAQQAVASLSDSLASMEKRYHQEEMIHVADSQVADKLKEELDSMSAQLATLTTQMQATEAALASQGEQWAQEQRELQERLCLLEEQLSDLEAQNCLLHDQLEVLSSKVPASRPQLNISGFTSSNSSINSSFMVEEDHTPEQLLKIIQFIRKDKSVIAGKLSASRTENLSLKVQLKQLEKQLLESRHDLVAAQKKVEVHVTAAREQEEKIKKAEMLFAMKDSNSMLREEREALDARVKELTEEREQARRELEPLRAANKELQLQIDKLSVESRAAREDVSRLLVQYSQLVENTARANQEERLQIQQKQRVLEEKIAAQAQDMLVAHDVHADLMERMEKLERVADAKEREHVESTELWQEKLAAAHNQYQSLAKELTESRNELKENAEIISYLREKLSRSETELEDSLRRQKQVENDMKKMEEEYKKKLEEVLVTATEAKDATAETVSSQEESGEQRMEDVEVGHEVAVEQSSVKVDQNTAPGLEVIGEQTIKEPSLDASTASPTPEQPSSQQSGTVLVTTQQLTPTTELSEQQLDANSAGAAVHQATEQQVLSPSASVSVESSQASSSLSLVQQVQVAEVCPQPGAKRPRDTEDDSSSGDSRNNSSLQAKRTCIVEDKLSVEETVDTVCEEVVSHKDYQQESVQCESKTEASDVRDSTVGVVGMSEPVVPEPYMEVSIEAEGTSDEMSNSVGESAGAGYGENSGIGEASPKTLPVEEHHQELLQPGEVSNSLASGDTDTASSSQTVCAGGADTTAQLSSQGTCIVVTEGNKTSELTAGAPIIPTIAVAHSSGESKKLIVVTGKTDVENTAEQVKLVNPLSAGRGNVTVSRIPTPGSSEGRSPVQPVQWLRRDGRMMLRTMGPGRCRMIPYLGSPLPVVLHRPPGGRPPVLRRMFRGRARPFMRGHDRQ